MALSRELKGSLEALIETFKLKPSSVDLLLDMEYVSSSPDEKLVTELAASINSIPSLDKWRTITLSGGSFPEDLAKVAMGVTPLKRHEWTLWRGLADSKELQRIPTFGDYAIQYPLAAPPGFKGTANIRYATENDWLVFKGFLIDEAIASRSSVVQFGKLAKDVVSHPSACPADFSDGDEYIYGCAAGRESSGSATVWRTVGTNHHITYVVNQMRWRRFSVCLT